MQSSSNPAFKNMEKVIGAQQQATPSAEDLNQMYQQPAYQAPARERFLTVDDVVTKTAIILVMAVVAGFATAYFEAYYLALPAALIGFVLSLVVIFKRKISPPLIIGYAIAEGIFLGAITGVFNQWYPGIAAQAIVGTARRLRRHAGRLQDRRHPGHPEADQDDHRRHHRRRRADAVQPGDEPVRFRHGLRTGGPLAIGFSLLCIALAAFSFLLDFDSIDKAIKQGAPANTSWYFAFGLMVTLVWLYLEILRLLSYMRN